MKQILLILLLFGCLSVTAQPLMGVISSSQNNFVSYPAQNIFLWSEDLTNSWWTKEGSPTILVNQALDLAGNNTMNLVTLTATTAIYRIMPLTASTTYYYSFDVKRGTATDLFYSVYISSPSGNFVVPTSYYSLTSSTEVRRMTFAITLPAGSYLTAFSIDATGGGGVAGTVYIGRMQLSTTPAPYVKTTTAAVIP